MLCADVIRMKDGRIFIGRVFTVNSDGVILLVFGEKITVQFNDILISDPDFRNLKGRELEIILKDSSTMLGKVQDYDTDVGLLVEIDFGVITVPPDKITSIMDHYQRSKQLAHFMQIGAQCGYYFMIGDLGSVFDINISAHIFSEFNLGFLFEGFFCRRFSLLP